MNDWLDRARREIGRQGDGNVVPFRPKQEAPQRLRMGTRDYTSQCICVPPGSTGGVYFRIYSDGSVRCWDCGAFMRDMRVVWTDGR